MKRVTVDDVRAAIVDAFIEKGEAIDAKAIAERMGVSVGVVRARINGDAHGCPRGCDTWETWRTSFSKDYPGMESGAHRVWVYAPARETLRQRILELTGEGGAS